VPEETEKVRAFVAIHAPAAVRENLRAAQRKLDSHMPKEAVRWTVFEQLHLTLEFLGDVSAAEGPSLEQALTKVAAGHRSFRLAAESIGAFSSMRNPRVIWAGLAGDIDRLKALQADVHARVIPWEPEPETRAYRPHLTLGRVRPIKPHELRKVSQALAAVTPESFGEWQVDEFTLMQSKLSPHGAQHSVLATFPLQPLER
jgi:RNA 2',3'-cyclic 3'-phosphodiesterase